ncbi:aminodeoxychorismate/anthranilate synthase component II [Candidatus Vidania fulgoroideorum]
MILLIDNYDSFTFNVYDILRTFRRKILIVSKIKGKLSKKIKLICIGPGTGNPKDYKKIKNLISRYYKKIPILGICLGHQIICSFFGLKITKVKKIQHGLLTKIKLKKDEITNNIPRKILVNQYNSLAIKESKNKDIKFLSTRKKEVMIIKHKKFPIIGIQFHPDSFICKYGRKIIINFIKKNEIFKKI